MRSVGVFAVVSLALVAAAEVAWAEVESGNPSSSAAAPGEAGRGSTAEPPGAAPPVVPPRLLGIDAERPLPTCDGETMATVLTIGVKGAVTDAVVQQGEVPGAELARRWALGLTFEPARRGAQTVVSKITFGVPCASPDEVSSGETPRVAALAPTIEETQAPVSPDPASLATEVASPEVSSKPADPTSPEEEAVDVVVRGESTTERLRRSANAVSVVELTSARQRTGTLGEVLARQEGASVRTMGGLGGFTRFSLDGLSNEQVRFFIDGVPLRFAGYSLGVANVPVDQLDHVEIYHGVVPAHFGADALGGAVNLSTLNIADGSVLSGSLTAGDFGTTRLSASATHQNSASHYLVRANAFRDRADNNFVLHDVPLVDSRGQLSSISRPHFHNRYAAEGVGLEVGAVDVPWARYLVVRGFYTNHDKQIPHDDIGIANQNPYGEVTYGRTASGILVKHQWSSRALRVDSRVGFTNERLRYKDVSRCSYDWYGRCAVERRSRGEVSAAPVDAKILDQFWFARVDGSWLLTPTHELRWSLAPTLSSRQGKDDVILAQVPDPLAAQRRFFTFVAGAEYETRGAGGGWVNNLFGKWYSRYLDASEVLPNGNPRDWDQVKTYGGVGDGFRINITDTWYAKTSYEYVIRFPSLEEIFGDGSQIVDNLELASERSHNANLEVHGSRVWDSGSEGTLALRTFGRFLRDRIWLQALTGYSEYTNVDSSRVLGVEGVVSWFAPGRWLFLSANGTWLHSRDTSGAEPVRLPSDPWFWANGQVTLTKSAVITTADSVNLDWNVNYIRGFPLSVGERGDPASRLRVDSQTVHTAALRYVMAGDTGTLSAAAEMNNVLDSKVMDFYGIQRAGRAFFLKVAFQVRQSASDEP